MNLSYFNINANGNIIRANTSSVYTYCMYYLGLRPEDVFKKYSSYYVKLNSIKNDKRNRISLSKRYKLNKLNYQKNNLNNKKIYNNYSLKHNSKKYEKMYNISELSDSNIIFENEENEDNEDNEEDSTWKNVENSENEHDDYYFIRKTKSLDKIEDNVNIVNIVNSNVVNYSVSDYLNIY